MLRGVYSCVCKCLLKIMPSAPWGISISAIVNYRQLHFQLLRIPILFNFILLPALQVSRHPNQSLVFAIVLNDSSAPFLKPKVILCVYTEY